MPCPERFRVFPAPPNRVFVAPAVRFQYKRRSGYSPSLLGTHPFFSHLRDELGGLARTPTLSFDPRLQYGPRSLRLARRALSRRSLAGGLFAPRSFVPFGRFFAPKGHCSR